MIKRGLIMFKYLSLFVFLVGCGAPQTPDEVKADNFLQEFVGDCKKVHGDRCDVPMTVHSLSESADEQTCWTEDGNPIRSVVLHREAVTRGNRAAVYQELFYCSLNLSTLQSDLLSLEEFAKAIGLSK